MHHRIILRFALALMALLIAMSLQFAWAATRYERAFAASNDVRGAAYAEGAAMAAYDQRCRLCHSREETANWVSQQPAGTRESRTFEFLQQHGKAPEADNRLIAHYLAHTPSRP